MDGKSMELLAPAGDETALRAAVCAGADAVYLGYSHFGARASAANFDAEALEKAVAYAHLYHVRIHVTMNTLMKPEEEEAVFKALKVIEACHADAVIVQDLGVANMARESFPALDLHASTQMALHSTAGARFATAHGFQRVVLARECTLDTVRRVVQTGIDTEVFVHGALCTAMSGQCLLSSMAGGRSGNRGRCAQPCRQQVTLGGQTAALLSMRDLCLRNDLPALQAAGVASLKIEGRLKRPEYVAVVTDSYRKALDALAQGCFVPMDEAESRALRQIYHRGGFTRGHLMGEEDAALCVTDRVGHGGVAVGRVTVQKNGLAQVDLSATLHDGDGLRIESVRDVELRYSGLQQQHAATLRLHPGDQVHPGDRVVRLTDANQVEWAQQLKEPAILITMRATVCADQPMRLVVSDGKSMVEVTGETAQYPRTRALTCDEITRSLSKLADTPFVLQEEPEVETDSAFAPVSALNALRREALSQLVKTRREMFEANRPAKDKAIRLDTRNHDSRKALRPTMETLAVCFSDASAGQEFLQAGANFLLYAPLDWRSMSLQAELPLLPQGTWLVLPPQFGDEAFEEAWPAINAAQKRLGGVVLGSVGHLGLPLPLPIAFGDGIPLTNRKAAEELLNEDIAFFTFWAELNVQEIGALMQNPLPAPPLLKVYGHERVMLLNHCPERVARGLTKGRKNCALCKPGDRACASPDAAVTDRKGYRFPLRRVRFSEGCVLEMDNALPTDLGKMEEHRRALGAGMLLHFTVEPLKEQLAITSRFAQIMAGGKPTANGEATTAGHFHRGVE